MADEAYLIGGPRVAESYLNINKILEVAKVSKAEAIHPGYGLLSENAGFASRCEEAGLIFIGPSPKVISKMGSKIESRKAMEAAGVPVVPGITYPLADAEEAVEAADRIGYPVMLKASAGVAELECRWSKTGMKSEKLLRGIKKRATDFFGDGAMYIEKFVENPRHIEIQILADGFGNVVYLWERECSIQRRHQKVVEEAPSSFISEETRTKMGRLQ